MAKIAYGSIRSVNKYNKANGIVTEKKEEAPSKKVKPLEGAFVIADETVTAVSQEELDLLDNIVLKHDPHTVYMRSDIDAYDQLYFTDNSEITNDLLKEVRSLRRVYRNYRQYLNAMWLREVYLDSLEDQFGSEDRTIMKYKRDKKIVSVPPGTFIPPVPVYSRHASDWNEVKNGTFSLSETMMQEDEDAALEVIDGWKKSIDIDPDSIKFVTDVQTDRRVMNIELADDELEQSRFSGANSVNIADLDAMQKYMRYWYKKDTKEKELVRGKVPFPKSEEGMRKLTDIALGMQILESYYNKSSEDENEMVYDEKLKKPMTLAEYNRRCSLRTLCELGNWDITKLMSQMNVGSKYERKMAQRKNARSNKISKKVNNFFGDLEGDAAVDVDELRNYLFGGGNS